MLFRREKMMMVIGASRFGAGLASMLSERGHHVVILDKDEDSFRKLSEQFSGYEALGDGTDLEVLKQTGIEDARLVVASTDDDNTNMLIGQIASRIFGVEKVYVRLNDSEKQVLLDGFHIEPICPYVLSIEEFEKLNSPSMPEVS